MMIVVVGNFSSVQYEEKSVAAMNGVLNLPSLYIRNLTMGKHIWLYRVLEVRRHMMKKIIGYS